MSRPAPVGRPGNASRPRWPRWRAVVVAAASALCVAGCVTIPDGGPVQSAPVTQDANAQNQPYPQLMPMPPQPGATPEGIVSGFLTASASFADGQRVARDFLTPAASRAWRPPSTQPAIVFSKGGPAIGQLTYPNPGNRNLATVTVDGKVQATLSAPGAYAVPSASDGNTESVTFTLARAKAGGQWRIASAPPGQLLLTSTEFAADYQLRNLYFLDTGSRYLVPDPVYAPLRTTPSNLLTNLVRDLISPPDDWLHDGTRTAFPVGTRLLSSVMVNGNAAEVNLGGAVTRAGDRVRELISAQLLSTLSGSGQGQPDIQSVVLDVDGKPWSPPQAQQNPVQHSPAPGLGVPDGKSESFYYTDSQGALIRQPLTSGREQSSDRAQKVRAVRPGYSSIAVSPDGRYLAALRDGTLYTGPTDGGGALLRRGGHGYTTMSWDVHDRLWATAEGGVDMLRGDVTARSPQSLAAPEAVPVVLPGGFTEEAPVTAVRVAPDGVRVALVIGGAATMLAFGAIAGPSPSPPQDQAPPQDQVPPRSGRPAGSALEIMLSPFSVSGGGASGGGFSSVSWYGADNVVTLGPASGEAASGGAGPRITEYSVNGASSSQVSTQAGIQSITTSAGSELIAAARGGKLLVDPTTSGIWTPIGDGLTPAYPG